MARNSEQPRQRPRRCMVPQSFGGVWLNQDAREMLPELRRADPSCSCAVFELSARHGLR